MGTVFQAEDTQLKRRVALKVMHPDLAAKPAYRERFLREAQAAAALEHDHIVPIYQVGEERGMPFFAMQWLKGISLSDWLQNHGKIPITEIVRLGRQIALGLEAAHRNGLIHRDIKPANIWLEARGEGRKRRKRRLPILHSPLAPPSSPLVSRSSISAWPGPSPTPPS
jgi:serine/threonine protein kinase